MTGRITLTVWFALVLTLGFIRWLGSFGKDLPTRVSRFLFGDRLGFSLWLGIVLVLALTWRVGFFITDTYPIANAVANLADGTLAMEARDFQYSLTLGTQPGLHEYDGMYYARNYGQVVAAVPILWFLEVASAIGPARLVVAGAWSLGVIAFGRRLARRFGRRWFGFTGGSVALVAFVSSVVFATHLDRGQLPLVALQLSTIFAAGLVGVFCYRLVAVFHDQRVAVASGIGIALATPVGFWATIPKRHVLVTALAFASVYAFARSRQLDDRRGDWALGGAYGAVGLITWVHAFEGFFLMISLFVVDVVTRPRKTRRRIGIVAGVFFLSLLPMVLTNLFISGNPLQPPRLLPNVGVGGVELAPDPSGTNAGESGSTGSGTGSPNEVRDGADGSTGGVNDDKSRFSPLGAVFDLLAPAFGSFAFVEGMVHELFFISTYAYETAMQGISVSQEGDRIWNVFVRRGQLEYNGRNSINNFEAIDLTVLEATPILGVLTVLPAVLLQNIRHRTRMIRALSPRHQTDLLVALYVVVLVVVYLPRLPLFSQITVRYILPAIALATYGVVRIPAVSRSIEINPRLLAVSYVIAAIGGTVALVLTFAWIDPALGEAMQFHALLNLGLAGTGTMLIAGHILVPNRVPNRIVAASLGLVAGFTTAFVVLAAVGYFTYGPFALDLVREIARLIDVV